MFKRMYGFRNVSFHVHGAYSLILTFRPEIIGMLLFSLSLLLLGGQAMAANSGGKPNYPNSGDYTGTVDGTESGDIAIANANVIIDSNVGGNVYGGYSVDDAAVDENRVTINGGMVSGKIRGGESKDGAVTNNIVTIAGGTAEERVYGGEAWGSGNVSGNTVIINGGSVTNHVSGGSSLNGTATGNRVEITSGTVTSIVVGGSSMNSAATNNAIALSGGTFVDVLFTGGHSGDAAKDVSGNKVDITGAIVFSGSNVIYGGSTGPSEDSLTPVADDSKNSTAITGASAAVTFAADSDSSLTIDGGAFRIASGGVLNTANAANLTINSATSIDSTSSLIVETGTTATFNNTVTNKGSITFAYGSTYTGTGSVDNYSTITVDAGMSGLAKLTAGTTMQDGSNFNITTARGAELNLTTLSFEKEIGSSFLGVGSTGDAVLTVIGTNPTEARSEPAHTAVNITGKVNLGDGTTGKAGFLTLLSNGDVTLNVAEDAVLTVTAKSKLDNNSTITNSGNLVFASGSTYAGTGDVINHNNIIADVGMIGLADLLVGTRLQNGSAFNFTTARDVELDLGTVGFGRASGAFAVGLGSTDDATLTLTGANTSVEKEPVTITINVTGKVNLGNGDEDGIGLLTVQSNYELNVAETAAFSVAAGSKINNAGTITNAGSIANNGNIIFASGSTYFGEGDVVNYKAIIADVEMSGLTTREGNLVDHTTLEDGSVFNFTTTTNAERDFSRVEFAGANGDVGIGIGSTGGAVFTVTGEGTATGLGLNGARSVAYAISGKVNLGTGIRSGVGSIDVRGADSLYVAEASIFTIAAGSEIKNAGTITNEGDVAFASGSTYSGAGKVINNNTIAADVRMIGLASLANSLDNSGIMILRGVAASDVDALAFKAGAPGRIQLDAAMGDHGFVSLDAGSNSLLIGKDAAFIGAVTAVGTDAIGSLAGTYAISIADGVSASFGDNVSAGASTSAIRIGSGSSVVFTPGKTVTGAVTVDNGHFNLANTGAASQLTINGSLAAIGNSVVNFGAGSLTTAAVPNTLAVTGDIALSAATLFAYDKNAVLDGASVDLIGGGALTFTGGDFAAWSARQGGGTALQKIQYSLSGDGRKITAVIARATREEAVDNITNRMIGIGIDNAAQILASASGLSAAVIGAAQGNAEGTRSNPDGSVNSAYISVASDGATHANALTTWRMLRTFGGMSIGGDGFSPAEVKLGASVLTGSGEASGFSAVTPMVSANVAGVNARVAENNIARASIGSSDSALASAILNSGGYQNRFWLSGLGQWERASRKDASDGFNLNTYGTQFGYDRLFGSITAGLALGYSRGNFKQDAAFDNKTTIDNYAINLYSTYNHRSGFFATVIGGYAYSGIKTRQNIIQSDYHANTWNIGGILGYDIKATRNFTITPSAGLLYYHSRSSQIDNNFTTIESLTDHNTQLPIDLAVRCDIPVGAQGKISLVAHGGYAYNFRDSGAAGMLTYNNIVGVNPIVVAGRKPGRSQWNAGGEIKFAAGRFDIGVKYDWYRREAYNAHRVQATVGVSF